MEDSNNVSWSGEKENVETSGSLDAVMGAVYFYLTGIMSVLSMAGSIIIIIIYLTYPVIRTSGRKMLVWLSVADFLTAMGNLMGICWYINRNHMDPSGSMAFCKAHASITIFSSISSFFWTVAIGVHLYICIVIGSASKANRITIPCHILCWILPGLIASVALGVDVLGYDKNLTSPSWCWVDPEVDHALFWQYFTGKLWEMLSYVTVCVMYAIIKHKLHVQVKKRAALGTKNKSNVISDANKKLTFVPVVFIFVRIWGTLRFIMGAHFQASGKAAAWIVPLQGLGDSAQGFANCILFCTMTDKVRNKINKCMCEKCTKTNKDHNEDPTSIDETQESTAKANQVGHIDHS